MNPLLAADEPWGGNFEVPPVGELFNFEGFDPFGIEALGIDRVVLIIFTATLLAILLFVLGLRNPSVVPGKLQNVAESLIDVVRNQIALPIIGPEGHRYVPVLTTLFIFIWFNNLFEVIPFVNFPTTSRPALPIMLGRAGGALLHRRRSEASGLWVGSRKWRFRQVSRSSFISS